MSDFKKQIDEDLLDYAQEFPTNENMKNPEWAFNYWILDNLFDENKEDILEKIVDRHDKGVDAFVWHEDDLELYLIQNKYYSEGSKLTSSYVEEDFLQKPLIALRNGTYNRSKQLQDIYSKYHNKPNFKLHLCLYITNNSSRTQKHEKSIEEFNKKNEKETAQIFWLDDIKSLYFEEPISNTTKLSFDLDTVNEGTNLKVVYNYNLPLPIEARYILTPLSSIYKLLNFAKTEKYDLFSKNVRDYLGATGKTNSNMMKTLENEEDRKYFFYYNNGITMIVDDFSAVRSKKITIKQPKIINGCQTTSTIYEYLQNKPEEEIKKFDEVYVMVKALKIPSDNEDNAKITNDIVRYNNSQNGIDPNTFEALKGKYKKIQTEFLERGILVCVKKSDKNRYTRSSDKINIEVFKKRVAQSYDLFGIPLTNNYTNYTIDLNTLLQTFVAFTNVYEGVNKRRDVLNTSSPTYKIVTNMLDNPDFTINQMFSLYLLYKKASLTNRDQGTVLNPFYAVYIFATEYCKKDVSKIVEELADKNKISGVVDFCKETFKQYLHSMKHNGYDGYNSVVKQKLNSDLMIDSMERAKQ